jgi:hypothetical protein
MWGGDLPCRHGEAVFYLVSLAQHTDVSSGSSTTEGYVISELWNYAVLNKVIFCEGGFK